MDEYFITYRKGDAPICRCSIGQLEKKEVNFFERESGIKSDHNYTLDWDVSLDSPEERYEHNEALNEFKRGVKLYDMFQFRWQISAEEYCHIPDDKKKAKFEIPHITKMVEFQRVAAEVRKANGRAMPLPSHPANEKPRRVVENATELTVESAKRKEDSTTRDNGREIIPGMTGEWLPMRDFIDYFGNNFVEEFEKLFVGKKKPKLPITPKTLQDWRNKRKEKGVNIHKDSKENIFRYVTNKEVEYWVWFKPKKRK